jgi:hemerythrin-like domain-containing protein
VAEDRRYFAHNPLDVIDHAHVLQVQLCDALERVADGLPDDVDRRLCAQIASALQYDLPLHHRDEEAGLFPLLRLRAKPGDGVETVLARLEREHDADTDFAGEIVEWLDMLGRGQAVGNPEMVGYMLRGFFECYRRHVHWEDVLVMPLARQRLTPADLVTLSEAMEKNRSQSQ